MFNHEQRYSHDYYGLKLSDLIINNGTEILDIEIYHILINLIFFNNTCCPENIINLSAIGYEDFEISKCDLSLRVKGVLARLKISSFQDLINYPSEKILLTRTCGKMAMNFLKFVVIENIVHLYKQFGFPENMDKTSVIDPELLREHEKLKQETVINKLKLEEEFRKHEIAEKETRENNENIDPNFRLIKCDSVGPGMIHKTHNNPKGELTCNQNEVGRNGYDQEELLPGTKNVFRASKKFLRGSNANDWEKIAEAAKKNIK